MSVPDSCPLCKHDESRAKISDRDQTVWVIFCPTCGQFKIPNKLIFNLDDDVYDRNILSVMIHNYCKSLEVRNGVPTIGQEEAQILIDNFRKICIGDKQTILINELNRSAIGEETDVDDDLRMKCFCLKIEELQEYIDDLCEKKMINYGSDSSKIKLTLDGRKMLESKAMPQIGFIKR